MHQPQKGWNEWTTAAVRKAEADNGYTVLITKSGQTLSILYVSPL